MTSSKDPSLHMAPLDSYTFDDRYHMQQNHATSDTLIACKTLQTTQAHKGRHPPHFAHFHKCPQASANHRGLQPSNQHPLVSPAVHTTLWECFPVIWCTAMHHDPSSSTSCRCEGHVHSDLLPSCRSASGSHSRSSLCSS